MAVNTPIFARYYNRASQAMDRGGMAERRQELQAGLAGEIIEIGAGTGLSFAHYPPAVTRVTAIEPEPRLRQIARRAASKAPVPIDVIDGLAGRLPVADGRFDAAVVAMVLCSLPDTGGALREVRRVLKPGGELRFLEHVRADTQGLIRMQRALDATIWPRLFGGCHLGRDTATAIADAGFTISRMDEFLFPEARTPVSFYILGTASSRP